MKDREPKRWECLECGHVNKKTRTIFPRIDGKQRRVHVCYICSGKIKESDAWLAWHGRMIERTKPGMMQLLESKRVRQEFSESIAPQ